MEQNSHSNNFKVTSSNWLRVINLKKTRVALDVLLSSKISRKAFRNIYHTLEKKTFLSFEKEDFVSNGLWRYRKKESLMFHYNFADSLVSVDYSNYSLSFLNFRLNFSNKRIYKS